MNRKRWTLLVCLMAVAITCLTLIARGQDGQRRFSDVPDDHQFIDGIEDAYWGGWINGYPDGTFRPDERMSDRQIISVMVRMFARSGGITRGQMADLITEWYPDLKWGNPEPCEQIPEYQMMEWPIQSLSELDWCVFLPITRPNSHIGIRFAVVSINWFEYYQSENIEAMTRFYNNEWIYPREPGLVLPIGSVQVTNDEISVIVRFTKSGRDYQVNRTIYTGSDNCPGGRMACWSNETNICHSNGGYAVDIERNNCWLDISKIPTGGQKWPPSEIEH